MSLLKGRKTKKETKGFSNHLLGLFIVGKICFSHFLLISKIWLHRKKNCPITALFHSESKTNLMLHSFNSVKVDIPISFLQTVKVLVTCTMCRCPGFGRDSVAGGPGLDQPGAPCARLTRFQP